MQPKFVALFIGYFMVGVAVSYILTMRSVGLTALS